MAKISIEVSAYKERVAREGIKDPARLLGLQKRSRDRIISIVQEDRASTVGPSVNHAPRTPQMVATHGAFERYSHRSSSAELAKPPRPASFAHLMTPTPTPGTAPTQQSTSTRSSQRQSSGGAENNDMIQINASRDCLEPTLMWIPRSWATNAQIAAYESGDPTRVSVGPPTKFLDSMRQRSDQHRLEKLAARTPATQIPPFVGPKPTTLEFLHKMKQRSFESRAEKIAAPKASAVATNLDKGIETMDLTGRSSTQKTQWAGHGDSPKDKQQTDMTGELSRSKQPSSMAQGQGSSSSSEAASVRLSSDDWVVVADISVADTSATGQSTTGDSAAGSSKTPAASTPSLHKTSDRFPE
ncbi:hypothetical protein GE09DRAFT_1219151 [Coniochaeta sp. 2T2.1]|nr:hypothetical protein GE09DRAFT_1219151 [Coniochaeta sp. 2T2.1]